MGPPRSRRAPAPTRALLSLLPLALFPLLTSAVIVEKFFTISAIQLTDPTCATESTRETIVVNGQWPGPTIEATEGDTLVVHVTNNQPLGVTLHWHGLAQEDAQWYDGVPGITQCVIPQGTTFVLRLPIRGQWGTFWYHAHTNQMRNTVHGAVIIHPPRNTNPEPLPVPIYDELLMLGGDWYPQTAQELDDTILNPTYPGFPLPTALHISGRTNCNPKFYVVKQRRWYRLRIINTALWASFNLRIEKHTMIIHETEGGYLKHRQVNMLDVYPGQSYSVLIYTNQKPGNFWIVLNSRYDVEKSIVNPAAAVLAYESAGLGPVPPSTPWPTGPKGTEGQAFGVDQQAKLRAPYYNQYLKDGVPQKLIVLEMNQNTLTGGKQVFSINNVSFAPSSPTPFLLADYQGTSDSVYSSTILPDLPPEGLSQQMDGPTKLSPSVITIPYGAWVQVVFQNHVPPGALHPFHIHGQNFYVVAQGTGVFNPKKWASYNYNLKNPPLRNTVALFEKMWVAVRFQATNPGQWIVHCHLEQHADQGLLAIFKVLWPTNTVGQNGPVPLGAPPTDYPTCPSA